MQQEVHGGRREPAGRIAGGHKRPGFWKRRFAWHEGARLLERLRLFNGWDGALERLGIADDVALRVASRARENGTGFHAQLVADNVVPEISLTGALAAELGVGFASRVDPQSLIVRDGDLGTLLSRPFSHIPVRCHLQNDTTALLVASRALDLPAMKSRLDGRPGLRRRFLMAPPRVLRAALFERARARFLDEARHGLFSRRPEYSARLVSTSWQGVIFGMMLLATPVAYALSPVATLTALLGFATAVFLLCVGLRIAALAGAAPARPISISTPDARSLPVYSILIALRGEAAIVDQLMGALGKIVWPRSKLEIKFVCEADDEATLAAIARHGLEPWMEVIEVPASQPRTKPKALCYALPAVSGEIVALLDAEDRPHPMQLLEAWSRFRADPKLACVQAPLVIANGEAGMLPLMFRLEYALHFNGILPWLARRGLFFPLGGTSNHFRRRALIEVGAWDPYNVTEDADLGARFARHGFRCGTIACPTLEDAPDTAGVWLGQRTRWFKGWMQTWFVHMRRPLLLMQQLGPGSFLTVQIMLAGLVASALAHPVLLASIGGLLAKSAIHGLGSHERILLAIALINLLLGYGSFLLLGWCCLHRSEKRGFWKSVLFTPAYWLMMSFAALRAGWHLFRRPHYWEKTPHKPSVGRVHPPVAVRERLHMPGAPDRSEPSSR